MVKREDYDSPAETVMASYAFPTYACTMPKMEWTVEAMDQLFAACMKREKDLRHQDGKFVIQLPDDVPSEAIDYLTRLGFRIYQVPGFSGDIEKVS